MQESTLHIIQSALVSQLKKLGLKQGDMVMLHASMRVIGTMLGGPDIVRQALIETISHNGTLMMYVGCKSEYEVLGRARLFPLVEKQLIITVQRLIQLRQERDEIMAYLQSFFAAGLVWFVVIIPEPSLPPIRNSSIVLLVHKL